MQKRVVILTGTSRGLGAAMAAQLLEEGVALYSISRSTNHALSTAKNAEYLLHHCNADLSTVAGCEIAKQWLDKVLPTNAQVYDLIHNAGTVAPIALGSQLSNSAELAAAFQLNIAAVIDLSAFFLQHSQHATLRRILTISSGAGRAPVAGWGVYGATKAALDYYTQALVTENHPNLRCVALAPGVIDTAMQDHIRAQSHDNFPNLSRFHSLHENGQLQSTTHTAQRILHYLADPNFGTHTLDDIRPYL